MVEHRRLERALAEFAQLLLADFAVADVLRRLCEHTLQVLDADGAGVSLPESSGIRVGWAAGPRMEQLEGLQRELREGPCLDVLNSGVQVQARLAQSPGRWPAYGPRAQRLGVQALAALPLRARGEVWGVLDVYRFTDRPFSGAELDAAQVLADTATAYLLAAHDRQARRLAEDDLRLQALHDPLTGLPNRLLLLDRLQQVLATVSREPGSAGLLFLDLDRFKQVNDAHGHVVGDRLLRAVAGRLTQALRPMDTLARLGGDEFVVLCQNLHDDSTDLAGIGRRLLSALSGPITLPELPGGQVVVRGSVGAVLLVDGDEPHEVLHHADTAMYAAKRGGGGVVLSDRVVDADAAVRLRTDTELEHALARGQFRLAFQPVVGLQSGVVVGQEALLRWEHPQRGLLTAAHFLSALERTGLIVAVGRWVLREVCRQLPALTPAHPPVGWFVAVNLSVQQLQVPGFADEVSAVLAEFEVDPAQLVLEITETALVPTEPAVAACVRDLADRGLLVALDDFGTGYSSLTHLKHFPAHILKIDKSFVSSLVVDERDRALVCGTVTLAQNLGLRVVAEGVEDPRQHDLLVLAGCDAGQGYLYGRPEPVAGVQAG